MPPPGNIIIYVNGTQVLNVSSYHSYDCRVSPSGLDYRQVDTLGEWENIYSAGVGFLGLSTTEGASVPDSGLAIGDTFRPDIGSHYYYSVAQSITDITGYTWTCSSTTCSAGYGQFHVQGTTTNPNYSNVDFFSIGYAFNFRDGRFAYADSILINESPGYAEIGDSITFTGGTDVTNATLIAWLEANGTLTAPQITDLTGCTWVGNNSINVNTLFSYSISFTSYETQYISLSVISDHIGNILVYDIDWAYGSDVWFNEDWKTIQITGGTDATNAALIAWLESNGTLTAPQPQLTVDLSTLAGWSNVSAGNHTLKVKAEATGYRDSALSVGRTLIKAYPINTSITNGRSTGDTYIFPNDTATIQIIPETDYDLPLTVSVQNADSVYDSATGIVSLSNPIGSVTVEAICEISGWGRIWTEEINISPTLSEESVEIPEGYDGANNIVVNGISIDTTHNTGSSNGSYIPSTGQYFNSFTVQVPEYDGNEIVTAQVRSSSTPLQNSHVPADTRDLSEYGRVWTEAVYISPTTSAQSISGSIPTGYDAVSNVIVHGIPIDSIRNSAPANGNYSPSTGAFFNSFTIAIPEYDGSYSQIPQ